MQSPCAHRFSCVTGAGSGVALTEGLTVATKFYLACQPGGVAPLGSIFVRPKIDEKAAKGGVFPRLVESTPLVLRGSASDDPRPEKSPAVPGDASTPSFHGSWPYGWTVSLSGPFPGAAAVPSRRCPGPRQPQVAAPHRGQALVGRQRTPCLAVYLARSSCFPGSAGNRSRP